MTEPSDVPDEIMERAAAVVAAVQEAVREALIEHKRAGHTVVFWENGKVRWVPAEEIEIPDPPPKKPGNQ